MIERVSALEMRAGDRSKWLVGLRRDDGAEMFECGLRLGEPIQLQRDAEPGGCFGHRRFSHLPGVHHGQQRLP